MARARPFQSAVTAGEFSPRLDGRVDIQRYGAACKTLENFIALPHGAITRRPGTHYVATTKTQGHRVRLIPFEFSDTQAYVIEFGHLYARFYMNHGQIVIVSSGELLANGTFNADLTGWAVQTFGTGTVTWDAGTQAASVTGTPLSDQGYLRQTLTIALGDIGRTFQFRINNRGPGSAHVGIGAAPGGGGGYSLLPLTTIAPGQHTFSFVSTSTTIWLEIGVGGKVGTGSTLLDDVSVQLVGGPYEIVSPYTVAQLPRVKWVQSADVMYMVHPDHPVYKLSRTAHTAWTLNPVVFLPPPTTEVLAKPNATLTPGATTGNGVTFTASAASFLAGDVDRHIIYGASRAVIQTVSSSTVVLADILDAFPSTAPIPIGSWGLNGSPNAGTLDPDKKEPVGATVTVTASIAAFHTTDVGKYLKLNDGIIRITTYVSATQVKGEIVKVLSTDTAAAAGTWTLEETAWSATRGYPAAVTFHEGRCVYTATYEQPQTIWGSASGDFENFAVGTAAGDSYEFSIAANKVNIGRWLLPSRVLLVGTKGGEFRVTGGNDAPITPTNVDAKSETAYGSNFVNPVRVGAAILFCQRSGRKLRELAFSMDFDSYVAPDLTVLAEHIFPIGKTMAEMDFQQDPDPLVWVVRSDGLLCALSYDRSNDVVGWHRHPVGGSATVESVAVIPHPDGDRDEVWLAIKRTVNGIEVRYVEYLDDSGGYYGALNVDSGLTYHAGPATSFAGLDHLQGHVVAIVGDGAYYGEQTVPASGTVVISPAASQVEIGLPYTSTFETLRQEIPGPGGSSQGQKKRQPKVNVRAIDTMGVKINGYQQPARRSTDLVGSPPSLFTGDYESSKLGWDTEARNIIIQALPFPATLLGIFSVTDVAEY